MKGSEGNPTLIKIVWNVHALQTLHGIIHFAKEFANKIQQQKYLQTIQVIPLLAHVKLNIYGM
jgi:hypothetical protein